MKTDYCSKCDEALPNCECERLLGIESKYDDAVDLIDALEAHLSRSHNEEHPIMELIRKWRGE